MIGRFLGLLRCWGPLLMCCLFWFVDFLKEVLTQLGGWAAFALAIASSTAAAGVIAAPARQHCAVRQIWASAWQLRRDEDVVFFFFLVVGRSCCPDQGAFAGTRQWLMVVRGSRQWLMVVSYGICACASARSASTRALLLPLMSCQAKGRAGRSERGPHWQTACADQAPSACMESQPSLA